MLQVNGASNLAVTANGSFTFPTPMPGGAGYTVSVVTEPSNPSQTCAIADGSGTVSSNVTSVQLNCVTTAATTYTVGGIVSGLSGSGLILQNNRADDLAIIANGTFTFASAISAGSPYAVAVTTQPSNPLQTCSTSNAVGTASATVTSVTVTCSTTTYNIGGTLSGLTSGTLVLDDNGDDLSLTADGPFSFAAPVAAGSGYNIALKVQPAGASCTVANGSGMANADVRISALLALRRRTKLEEASPA